MRISDWSSDVCSSDLFPRPAGQRDKLAVHIMIEMPVARSFGPPDQAAVRPRVEAVRQVDPAPRPRFLGTQPAPCARRVIDAEHVAPLLAAILAPALQRIAVWRPTDTPARQFRVCT